MSAAAVTTAAAAVLVGTFSPWLRSGASKRSSFELFDLADRLGYSDGSLFTSTVRVWPLVPLAVVGAVVAVWFGRRHLAGWIAVLAGCYVTAVAIAVRSAADTSLFRADWGVTVSAVGAVGLVLAGIGVLVLSRATDHG